MKIDIRKATENDSYFFYYLKNDDLSRNNSPDNLYISTSIHEKWYAQSLVSNKALLVVGSVNKEKIGVCRFKKLSNDYVISFTLLKKFRGLNLSKSLVEKSIQLLITLENSDCFICANVRNENIPSQKLLNSLGFLELTTLRELEHPEGFCQYGNLFKVN